MTSKCGKYTLLIIILLLNAPAAFSQLSKYSLLWKITGKGLTKPSYLFGTMHVKDKRVFNFSDSVMLCLKDCNRFALEVHPDTLISIIFASLQRNDTLRNIDKLLDSAQYKQLAEKFEKKNGYPMGKIDPMVLESLMEPKDDNPDDQVSFIDAYLYGIARTLNKSVFGLENAATQYDQYFGLNSEMKDRLLELLDDDNDVRVNENKEELIKIYSTGDLGLIYKYLEDNGGIDSSIIARNKVMANSMINDMSGGSLFTAVGTAHLPGPDGVIELLRKAGYNVTKVGAGFTGVAAKFHIDYMKMNWPQYKNENMGYAIDFPGTPAKYKVNGISTLIYPDIANDNYYGIYSVQKGSDEMPANSTEIIKQVITNMSKNKRTKILSRKVFSSNNNLCTELLMKTNSGYSRVRIFVANNILYGIYTDSKHNHLNDQLNNRFFSSFTSIPIPKKATIPWINYSNQTGAFSIDMPGRPDTIVKDIPKTISEKETVFKINMYLSLDTANARSYLVRFNDYPTGFYIKDKSILLDGLTNDFQGKGKVIGTPLKIKKDGLEGREFNVILTGGSYIVVQVYLRGNRTYLLMKETTKTNLKDQNSKDRFFESFKFAPFIEPNYDVYQPEDSSFRISFVSKPRILKDSSKIYDSYLSKTITYYTTNPNSGGVYAFEHTKLSPYYRVPGIDSLYNKLTKLVVGYGDSVIKRDTVVSDGEKALELTSVTKATGGKKRLKLVIDGDNLFVLTGYMDSEEFFSSTGNTVFSSLKIMGRTSKSYDYSSSKARKIFADLKSIDTLIFNEAKGALSYYDFDKRELPNIYTALQSNYPDDSLAEGARGTLIKKLITLNDDTTVSFLVKLYNNLKGKDNLKGNILTAIPSIDKKNGYNLYLNLLTSNPPYKAEASYYGVFSPFTDSVEFAAIHFEEIMPLLKNKNFRNSILRVANEIANQKNSSFTKIINKNYTRIMTFAMDDLRQYLAIKDSANNEWAGYIYNYTQLMDKIKSPRINDDFTKNYIDKDPKGVYAPNAIIARIYNDLPNKPLLVAKFLDSIDTRYEIMEAYDNRYKLNMVPLKYRTQPAFAKLNFYKYITLDDYGNAQKIALLGNIIKNGMVYYVFKYELPEKEEGTKFIGITGPYKPGSSKINFKKYLAYTNYDAVKVNWRLQASKMTTPLIEAYK